MIAAALHDFRSFPARVWWWVRLHPRATTIILGALMIVLPIVHTATAAYAAGPNSLPFYPDNQIKDSHQVYLTNYDLLPYDRGGPTDIGKQINAFVTDNIWHGYLRVVYWCLWLLRETLTFGWITWIEQPLNMLANLIGTLVTRTGWIPLALTAAGFVVAVFLFRGKLSRAIAEVALCIACAVGFALITGVSGGPGSFLNDQLNGTQNVAGSAAASIHQTFSGNDTNALQTIDTESFSLDSSTAPADQITSSLADLMVRIPAQTIAFGHVLSGGSEADKKWDWYFKMKPSDITADIKGNNVWCNFGNGHDGCPTSSDPALDQGAYDFATDQAAFFGQSGAAIASMFAQLGLVIFTVGFVVVIGWCLFWALYSLVVLIFRLAIGAFPGTQRGRIIQAAVGAYLGLILVGGLVIVAAFGIEFTSWLVRILNLGANASMLVTVALTIIAVILWRLRKQGVTAAQALSRIGSKWGIRGHDGATAQSKGQQLADKTKSVVGDTLGKGATAGTSAINPALGTAAAFVVSKYKARQQGNAEQAREEQRAALEETEQARHEEMLEASTRTAGATEYLADRHNPNLGSTGRHGTRYTPPPTPQSFNAPRPPDPHAPHAGQYADDDIDAKFAEIVEHVTKTQKAQETQVRQVQRFQRDTTKTVQASHDDLVDELRAASRGGGGRK